MPAAKDLTGRVFGALEVLNLVGVNPNISKNRQIWLCKCRQCGREEEISQSKLPHAPYLEKKRGIRYACTICMRGACEICGFEIVDDIYKGVCSEACHLERRRKHYREFHYRRLEENPDYWKQVNAARIERRQNNPDALEEWLKKSRDKSRINRERNGDHINALARARYAENRDQALTARKERLNRCSEEELIIIKANRRQYAIEYWEDNREAILQKRREALRRLSPEALAKYIEDRRQYNRKRYQERKAQEALGSLLKLGGVVNGIDEIE